MVRPCWPGTLSPRRNSRGWGKKNHCVVKFTRLGNVQMDSTRFLRISWFYSKYSTPKLTRTQIVLSSLTVLKNRLDIFKSFSQLETRLGLTGFLSKRFRWAHRLTRLDPRWKTFQRLASWWESRGGISWAWAQRPVQKLGMQ